MNEMICRGWGTEYDRWFEGYYVHLTDQKGQESHRIYTGYAESDCGEYYPDWFEVDPATVGRFAGLSDRKGKRIFERDVVRTGKEKRIVRFRNGAFELLRRASAVAMYALVGTDVEYEVIGNSRENPELLEVKSNG